MPVQDRRAPGGGAGAQARASSSAPPRRRCTACRPWRVRALEPVLQRRPDAGAASADAEAAAAPDGPASRKALAGRRLVVKVGSALLVEPGGTVRAAWLDGLARDVAALRARGQQVVDRHLRRHRARPPAPGPAASRTAAGGEAGARPRPARSVLARAWQESLARVGLETAQLLITLDDTEARRRYLNARATIETLLAARRGAGGQRERHGGHQRDPLRRQ